MHPLIITVWLCFLHLTDGSTAVVQDLATEADCRAIPIQYYADLPMADALKKASCVSVSKKVAAAD